MCRLLLGLDFQKQHQSVIFHHGGPQSPLKVCGLSVFEVETDASEFAIAATLNQKGLPVAFFINTLQGSEIRHASVEKEAQAIIRTISHWKHFLTVRYFLIKTDECSVSYIFNTKQRGKIKNDKMVHWRIELSCYNFDIECCPGAENIAADTFSRYFCAAVPAGVYIAELHDSLCHLGITHMLFLGGGD